MLSATMDKVFKALADPSRRLIIEELSERKSQSFYELYVRLVMKHDIKMSQQAVAKHIAILEKAGLVRSEFHGRFKRLSFCEEPLKGLREKWLDTVLKE